MKYAIVYSSKTGNTRLLAETIRDVLKEQDCVYFGSPSSEALCADRIYLGFWTDKGTCDSQTADFLSQLTTQKLFLFGTAGVGGSPSYFENILSAVKQHISSSVSIIGEYMCQGKMPMAVRHRYEAMENNPHKEMMLQNFDLALTHPNTKDLEQLKTAIKNAN
jgi:flavodoxin I